MSTATPITEPTSAIAMALKTQRRRTLQASLHPGLATLCSAEDEHAYLLRRDVQQIEALGPIPPANWLDEAGQVRTALDGATLAALGLAWRPCPDLAALDLSPTGVWYAARQSEEGIQYLAHTHGYYEALGAFLASPGAPGVLQQAGPYPVGVVPFVALYPDGRWEAGTNATAQPVLLALRDRDDLATQLAAELGDILYDRTWPM